MAKLQLTLPEGVHASNGKHITFRVPDNCVNITGVVIENVTYDLYDTYGNNVDFQSFMADSMVSITIDEYNKRAILLSSAPQVFVANISGGENTGYQCDTSLLDIMKANSINQVVIAKYGDAIYTFGNCSDSVAEFYRCDISSSDDFNLSIIQINEFDGEVSILPMTSLTFIAEFTRCNKFGSNQIIVGEKYAVTWNETKYICEAFIYRDSPALGNAGIDGGTDTGEPFLFWDMDSAACFISKSTSDNETIACQVDKLGRVQEIALQGIELMDKNGSEMSGALILSADPTENLQAATKQYVDKSLESFSTRPYIISDTAPDNTNLFWIDSGNANFMKAYDDTNSKWIPISAAFG